MCGQLQQIAMPRDKANTDKDRQTHRQTYTQSCSQGCRSSSWTFGFMWRFRTHICLNYFQFSQLPDPPDPPELLLLLCKSKCRGMSATMAIVQPCPANPHAHTHTHILTVACTCLFGGFCAAFVEVSQFAAYVCSLMQFRYLCTLHSVTCVFASN